MTDHCTDIVIFGGSGDLSLRKLLPALYQLIAGKHTQRIGRILCCSRFPLTAETFRAQIETYLRDHAAEFSPDNCADFLQHILIVCIDALDIHSYPQIRTAIADYDARPKLFYLATPPELFGPICQNLLQQRLIPHASRVVLEKPIGSDLNSCRLINAQVAGAFDENAIFRIDHYLGKETVQNLLALRFGNALLAPVWNNQYISNVQITVAETVGIEGRTSYYTKFGAFKDMVQNHLLQLLCLVAMEPPNSLNAHAVRDEKVKVLRALTPFDKKSAAQLTIRGQYSAGEINKVEVPGYADEIDQHSDLKTETFVALRATIDNWRWAGVPFYLRTGKRLAQRVSQIVIEFKPQAFSIFPSAADAQNCNRLVIQLQPNENITLWMLNKKPGLAPTMTLQPVVLDLTAPRGNAKDGRYDAYVRLLLDVLNDDQTLFMRRDEVEAAWSWADQLIAAWQQLNTAPLPYRSGSMGPDASIALLTDNHFNWFSE